MDAATPPTQRASMVGAYVASGALLPRYRHLRPAAAATAAPSPPQMSERSSLGPPRRPHSSITRRSTSAPAGAVLSQPERTVNAELSGNDDDDDDASQTPSIFSVSPSALTLRSRLSTSINSSDVHPADTAAAAVAFATSAAVADGERRESAEGENVLSSSPPAGAGVLDAARAFAEARQLLADGDVDGARTRLSALVAAHSQHSEALRTWGWLEAQQRNVAAARQLFQRAVRAGDGAKEAAAWCAWALAEQREGNLSTARKCFLHGLRADATHVPLFTALATFEAKHGEQHTARELFRCGVALDESAQPPPPQHLPPPKQPPLQSCGARLRLAWAAFEHDCGQLSRARRLYRRAAELDPQNLAVTLAWARFEAQSRRPLRARQLYSQLAGEALKRPPLGDAERVKVLHAWATMEADFGDAARARELFNACLHCLEDDDKRDGDDGDGDGVAATVDARRRRRRKRAPIYQAWAVMERRSGDIARARELFELGARADAGHAYVWQAWALMECSEGQLERARRYFRRGIEADHLSAPTYQAWARMEYTVGDVDRARELFCAATHARPNHAPSWHAWAATEAREGHFEAARRLFERAVRAEPHAAAPSWRAWAQLEAQCGEFSRARELFQRGVDASPARDDVCRAWARMEEKLGTGVGPKCSLPRSFPLEDVR